MIEEAFYGFPGNGVHSAAYFDKDIINIPENKLILEAMNRHAGYDLVSKMFDKKERKLINDEKGRQIATVGGSVMNAIALEKLGIKRIGSYGLSLGSCSASGIECIDWKDKEQINKFIKAIAFRAETMYACVPKNDRYKGNKFMAAIENLKAWRLESICKNIRKDGKRGNIEIIRDPEIIQSVVVGNENLPYQNVLSGDIPAVEKAVHSIQRKYPNAEIIYLDNGGPWHNPDYMRPASEKVGERFKQVPFKKPKRKLYLPGFGGFVENPEDIGPALGKEISEKTAFYKDTIKIFKKGFKKFVDVGPHKVLKGFWEKIVEQIHLPSFSIFDRQKHIKKITREIPVVKENLEEKIKE